MSTMPCSTTMEQLPSNKIRQHSRRQASMLIASPQASAEHITANISSPAGENPPPQLGQQSVTLQLAFRLRDPWSQIACWYAPNTLCSDAVRILPHKARLRRYFDEFAAVELFRIRAIHLPGKNSQLRYASRTDPTRIDRDVDRLTEIALGVASQGSLEEQFACDEVLEKGTELLAIFSVHVVQVVQGECSVGFTMPERIAYTQLVVSLAVEIIVQLGPIGGQLLWMGSRPKDAVDVVAIECSRDEIRIESVVEIVGLIWQRRWFC